MTKGNISAVKMIQETLKHTIDTLQHTLADGGKKKRELLVPTY